MDSSAISDLRVLSAPPPRRPSRTVRLAAKVVAVFAVVWLAWTSYWQLYVDFPGYLNFYAHQARYEGIVAQVKALHLKPGFSGKVATDRYDVWAQLSPTGACTISIVTQDWGHAGSYGYVYDEAEPVPTGDSYFPYDIPSSLPALETRLNHQWWTAYNGLD
jgi:hypothetical protein